jgi:hypothetical protein
MKPAQARRLIGQLMAWSDDQATDQFQWLDLMAQYKFDHYQGYGPGRRFYLTLLRWLSQFNERDRPTAFRLLREHLTFVSQAEMHHLVSRSGPQIQRKMRAHVAQLCGVPVHEVDLDPAAKRRLALLQERTLYVGASDGARIDVFRRFNEGTINNEQVVPTNEISDRKWKDLHKKLAERLAIREDFKDEVARFEWVCLIDDFSASATSSIHEEGGQWKGKVIRFLEGPAERTQLFLMPDAVLLIHHYLGTAVAEEKIAQACQGLGTVHSALRFSHSFAYVLPEAFSLNHCQDEEVVGLIQRHFDRNCGDNIVGYDIPFGYKRGGLPLVLEHNTPNNSIALLWAASPGDTDSQTPVVPLFPRRKRHMEIR